MKKFLAMLLAAVMLLSVAAFASAEGYTGEVKVWVADNVVDVTNTLIESFKEEHPEFAGATYSVVAMGEGDAASQMIKDVEKGADVYGFAQDQLARLVSAGAILDLAPENAEIVAEEHVADAVAAGTMGGVAYAYPMTADNTYFLYYDKSVITDPNSLEQILADCEAAGKKFYMEINSGWYDVAFFFGAGCTLTYDTADDGSYTACNIDYASENGLKALKSMIALAKSPVFINGSNVADATDAAAIVSGTWNAGAAQTKYGENYAACKLPEFFGYQMSSFTGYKLMGVKPQMDENKLALCDALALYLTSEKAQLARFEAVNWGPSNKAALASEAVQSNPAMVAVATQSGFGVPQGQYPGDYWSLAQALGDDIIAGKYNDMSDEDLMKVLEDFQNTCIGYAK